MMKFILVVIIIFLSFKCYDLTNKINMLTDKVDYLNNEIYSCNERIEDANSMIEDAKLSAWSSYEEMGDALDNLEEIQTIY